MPILLLLGLAASVAQATAAPPSWTSIEIRTCAIQKKVPSMGSLSQVAEVSPRTDGIRLQYVNHAPVAATHLTIVVNYFGQRRQIADTGTFAPEAAIDHTFTHVYVNMPFRGSQPEVCRVGEATFADGTVSTAPPPRR